MKFIYASKMYKASKRKDIIAAQLSNPNNQGLLIQLAGMLDEEYQTPEYTDPKKQTDMKKETHDEIPESLDPGLDEDFDPSANFVPVSNKSLPKGTDRMEDADENLSGDDREEFPDNQESNEGDAAEISPVQEASNINCSSSLDISVIKGSLNSRNDTAGVSRIIVKENELWIYYNDDKNLNNIMSEVIEYLSSSGYSYLEFNRLARSDNSMVFQITESNYLGVDV